MENIWKIIYRNNMWIYEKIDEKYMENIDEKYKNRENID